MRVFSPLPHALILAFTLSACSVEEPQPYDIVEKSATEISADFASGLTTSEAVTTAYIERIEAVNPHIKAVISINPDALEDARASDARRAQGQLLGPLDGVPILIKDNVDVAGIANTAGSLALANNIPPNDAPMVTYLRRAGVIILGKANLSEWANFRSFGSSSGWSAVGGLVRNPYNLAYTACGSSSGSGAAGAASLAAATIGTETDGSVTCPASINGLVGLKPTIGLVSRTGIIPISASQDTAGPMARTVTDTAALLTAMAGNDPEDPTTGEADAHKTNYASGLDASSLNGGRLGVIRDADKFPPATLAVFESALETLRAQGAELVDITPDVSEDIGDAEFFVLLTEFKAGLNDYLAGAPEAVTTRTLADVIAFNEAEPRELAEFDQSIFEAAEATIGLEDPEYITARDMAKHEAGPNGLSRMMAENDVIALLAPTYETAWPIDLENGDPSIASSSQLAAVSGYPHLTVPMGLADGLPVGLSFMGAPWSEQALLSLGYAYEQAAGARVPPPDLASGTPPAAAE